MTTELLRKGLRRAGQQFDPEVVECFNGIPQGEWELARQCRAERAIYRQEYRFSH